MWENLKPLMTFLRIMTHVEGVDCILRVSKQTWHKVIYVSMYVGFLDMMFDFLTIWQSP